MRADRSRAASGSVPRRCAVAFAILAAYASSACADGGGSAWRALERAQPAPEIAAQIPPVWRDALSRMSAQQLDELRRGASLSSIVLDGGETLGAFMVKRQLADVPLAVLADPVGGGTARGGSMLLDAVLLPTDAGVPNGSLTGGTLRLDPLLPGGGGTSTSAQFQLTGSVGQPTVAASHSAQTALQSGFWSPSDAIAVDRLFRDGFE